MTAGSPREETNGQTAADLVELVQKVDFRRNSCGDNGLVAMELGSDHGDLCSIPSVT